MAITMGGNGRTRKHQSDGDNDGSGDNGREVFQNLLDTKRPDQCRHDEIDESGTGHAQTGIVEGERLRESLRHTHLLDRGVASEESKRRAEESRHVPFGNEMEQECADSCEKQGDRYVETCEQGHENCGSKHGKQMLGSII